MFKTIVHAKLHQTGKPWDTWRWVGNVPTKSTARIQWFKDAMTRFGDEFTNLYDSELASILSQRDAS